MGQALYRKYRSQSLSEIVGQEHITTALQQAIDTNRISHAYLFTGPRGTGKTSIARILAHAINELPYSSDAHLDIIEIDAASNRRIDEIRELRDKVYIAPSSAKYKVYIIDEVHMLTREAFNALLKTLEEPPTHAVFMLATTDAHKVPETIISRTQRYSFRPVAQPKVIEHLQYIAKQEGITIEPEALELLAQHGEGSFRDSISMLDQVSNSAGSITADSVRLLLGVPPEDSVLHVIDSLAQNSVAAPVQALQQLYDQGFRAPAIANQLAASLRAQLTTNKGPLPPAATLQLLGRLLDVASSPNPERLLEIILMQSVVPAASASASQPIATAKPVKAMNAVATAPVAAPKIAAKPVVAPPIPTEPVKAAVAEPMPTHQAASGQSILDEAQWPEILAELKKDYNTLYGIIRMAQTDFSVPGCVSLTFKFAFHQKRITDAKNRKLITDVITHVTGQPFELRTSVSADAKPTPAGKPVSAMSSDSPLQDISAVFGGGELL